MHDRARWVMFMAGVLSLSAGGCSRAPAPAAADSGSLPPSPRPDSGTRCCSPSQIICTGDDETDDHYLCICEEHWGCDALKSRCTITKPRPDDGGDWVCDSGEMAYTCRGRPATLPGCDNWACDTDGSGVLVCKIPSPRPPEPPGAAWSCAVEGDTLVCNRGTGQFPACGSQWACDKDPAGRQRCKSTALEGGLPTGSDWLCSLSGSTWSCEGGSSDTPGGQGWGCVQLASGKWRCSKTQHAEDLPQCAGPWACMMGSAFGGEVCSLASGDCATSSWTPACDSCAVGERMWCDGLQYDGWGWVECDPNTGKWKTTSSNGKQVLDCHELADGRRPSTLCACYHFFLNPACCERPDCVVPAGSSGQICPPSSGALCDYCNPLTKTDCKEPGALCIVTNNHETYCGSSCETAACPKGYSCLTVKVPLGGTSKQCVPTDYSCIF